MNLKEAILKQQDLWYKRATVNPQFKYGDCYFCDYAYCCYNCPVYKALDRHCTSLKSLSSFLVKSNKVNASLVLDDVNRIATYYHLKQKRINKK